MIEYKTKGKHFIADIWFKEELPNIDSMVNLLCKGCGLNIVDALNKYFEPQGETRLYLLSESHLTIHTYPEHLYLSLDIYTCGDLGRPEEAEAILRNLKGIDTLDIQNIKRGIK